jgi:hypothetical protein
MPDDTEEKQVGQFQKGASGNPLGRPKGSRNQATLAMQALLEGEAEAITRKAIELAKAGEIAAIRLVLERLMPPRKDAPVTFDLPSVATPEAITHAMHALLQAVACGDLTPQEGQSIASLLETQRKCLETQQLAQKLDALQAVLLPRMERKKP